MSRTGIRLAFLGFLAIFLAGCDWFVAYTVVNQTDHPVTAWVLFESCETVIGHDGEYDYERTVPPGKRVDVSDVTGPLDPEPWCLQVVDEQRRLLLAEPYDYSAVYVVTDNLQPGVVVPDESDLPGESLGERLSETGPAVIVGYGLGLLFGLILIIALPYGIYRAIKDLRRYRRPSG